MSEAPSVPCCAALRAASAPIVFAPAQTTRRGENMQAAQRSSAWLRRADRTSVSTQSSRRGWRARLAVRGGVARIPRSILDRLGEDGALGSLHAARDARLDSVLQQRQAPPGATLLPMEDTAMSSVMGEEASIFCKVGARAAPCLPPVAPTKPVRSLAARATHRRKFQKTRTRRVHVGEKTP